MQSRNCVVTWPIHSKQTTKRIRMDSQRSEGLNFSRKLIYNCEMRMCIVSSSIKTDYCVSSHGWARCLMAACQTKGLSWPFSNHSTISASVRRKIVLNSRTSKRTYNSTGTRPIMQRMRSADNFRAGYSINGIASVTISRLRTKTSQESRLLRGHLRAW